MAYLRYLAHHPATATRIATQAGRHFVSDPPSDALVTTVAQAFTDSGTDIRATLRALVAHPDFLAGRGTLVRTPVEDFVATLPGARRDGAGARPTTSPSPGRASGVPGPRCSTSGRGPTGSPLGDAAWSSATRMLSSFRMHWNLAGRLVADQGRRLPHAGAAWLPAAGAPPRRVRRPPVRLVLGKPADARTVAAVAGVTGYGRRARSITATPRGRRLAARARDGASCSTPPTT